VDELDFEIPNTWKTAHLESITESVATKTYQIKESEVKPEGKYPVISQSQDFLIGFCDDESKLFQPSGKVIIFGDHTTVVKLIDFNFVIGADGVKIFIPNTQIISADFLYYILNYYTIGLEKIGGYSRHYKFIKNKPIPLPPLAEQKRIVAKIEEIMPFIDRYAVAYDHLQSYNTRFPDDLKKSILQMAIQGKLVHQDPNDEPANVLLKKIAEEKQKLVKEGKIKKQKPLPPIKEEEIPFDIPESWEWVRLGNVITDTEAGKSPKCKNRPATKQEWGVIKTTAIQDGYFLADENKVLPSGFQIKSDQVVHAGDLLITRAGPQNRTGVTCIVNNEPGNLILSDKTVRIRYVKGFVNENYLMYAMKSPAVQRCITGAKSGMAESQVNISQNNMRLFVLPFPPIAEQKRIVAKLDELIPQIDGMK
jgi:type I restriction enzyme S subunit